MQMSHMFNIRLRVILLLIAGWAITPITRADALSAVQLLREGGCGGTLPAARPLRRDAMLDRTAEEWAAGRSLKAATEGSGYRGDFTTGLHVSGPDSSMVQLLRRSDCRTLASEELRDIGLYHRGLDTWFVFAGAHAVPAASSAPALSARALQLINDVRARGTRCGERSFASAPPVTLSWTLTTVALGHATDMADHGYFEHEDLAGQSPADRVRAVGYHEKLVGENIAYGPGSVEEVMQGWLDSPGHCENIMDPRFAEMGIALAQGRAPRHGLYWVQLLVEPSS
jgi:uncharacterized protein YkwD